MSDKELNDLFLKITEYGYLKSKFGLYCGQHQDDLAEEFRLKAEKKLEEIINLMPRRLSEDEFWEKAWDGMERFLMGFCPKCPYKEECENLPDVDDGGLDCASFLREKYKEYLEGKG